MFNGISPSFLSYTFIHLALYLSALQSACNALLSIGWICGII